MAKTEQAIDYWVDRYDPHALRRVELSSQGRHVDVVDDKKGSGMSWIDGKLFSHDATRWISGWMRWHGRCVRPIRARSSSAAPMR